MRAVIGSLVLTVIPASALGAQLPEGARLELIAEGLANPWGVAFAPDGRTFVSERAGRIRVIAGGRLLPEPWAELPVARGGPGLLGLALSPDFARTGAVYVAGGFPIPSAPDSVFQNRLLRITERDGRAGRIDILLDHLPSARAHSGSAVAFGPDGMLYLSLGDAFRPDRSQQDSSMAGKILRLTSDGQVPADNPTPGSPVYARGLRNVQGLAWHPDTRDLFATEHGPSSWPWEGGRRDHDELNHIVPGGNYGWPVVIGGANDARYLDPLATWVPAIAPSGLAIYTGPYRPWRGQLFAGALRGRHLRRIAVARDAGRWRVTEQQALLAADSLGRIRGVFMGPDAMLYFTTSDRVTASGVPDDRIYRIRLPDSR
jgi:glucose/arabinose dehydrogenase